MRFAIVMSRFNDNVTEPMLQEALQGFASKGIHDVKVIKVPGAFELPLIAKVLAESKQFAAIVCIGAVIRGETSHYDYVCQNASQGILKASLSTNVPIIFSVLTTDTTAQAMARIKNGFEGALNAVELAQTIEKITCD